MGKRYANTVADPECAKGGGVQTIASWMLLSNNRYGNDRQLSRLIIEEYCARRNNQSSRQNHTVIHVFCCSVTPSYGNDTCLFHWSGYKHLMACCLYNRTRG